MKKVYLNLLIATVVFFIGMAIAVASVNNGGCASTWRWTIPDFGNCQNSIIYNSIFLIYPCVSILFSCIYFEYKEERNSSPKFIALIIGTTLIIAALMFLFMQDFKNIGS